jgi:hypothetical protein
MSADRQIADVRVRFPNACRGLMASRQHCRFEFLAGVMQLAVRDLGATAQCALVCRHVPPA